MNKHLASADVAAWTQLSADDIDALAADGTIRAATTSTGWAFAPADIAAWLLTEAA